MSFCHHDAITQTLIYYFSQTVQLTIIIHYIVSYSKNRYYKKPFQKSFISLNLLYANHHTLTKELIIVLCNTLVLSNFYFYDLLYRSCIDNVDKSCIQLTQKSCLRFIFGIRRGKRVSPNLKWAGWVSMCNRRLIDFACFCFRVLKYKTLSYLYDKIRNITDGHNLILRFRGLSILQ